MQPAGEVLKQSEAPKSYGNECYVPINTNFEEVIVATWD
jgi:hypothetical protein